MFEVHLGEATAGRVGAQHFLNAEYFKRIGVLAPVRHRGGTGLEYGDLPHTGRMKKWYHSSESATVELAVAGISGFAGGIGAFRCRCKIGILGPGDNSPATG